MGLSVPPFYLNKPNPIFSAANKYNSSNDWQILNIQYISWKRNHSFYIKGMKFLYVETSTYRYNALLHFLPAFCILLAFFRVLVDSIFFKSMKMFNILYNNEKSLIF